MIFLGVVIFVPFSLGRIILYHLSWLFSTASGPVLSTVMPLTESALSLANMTLKNALTAVTNLSTDSEKSGMVGQVAEILKVNMSGLNEVSNNNASSLSADFLKGATIGTSRLSDVTTLAIGYMFIFSLVFFYLGIVAFIRYTRGEPLTMGRFYGIASMAETIPSLFRQFLAAMRHLMTMIKVAFLLVIELGVFPLMCGWWLDVCTIRMFGKSMSHRVQFFSASPLASSLVHWVVGIVYMLQISIFVSLLRGVLFSVILLHMPHSFFEHLLCVHLFYMLYVCRFCVMEFFISLEIQLIQTTIPSVISLMILCTNMLAGSCYPLRCMGV